MVDSSLERSDITIDPAPNTLQDQTQSRTQLWIGRFSLILAVATLGLMALGSATRVMNAGLSCPDWPLCYGEWIPRDQMNLRVFLEWFHRLIAGCLGILTLGLMGWSWIARRHLPSWAPWMATFAVTVVGIQAILGGLTVTELLRFDIVTAHLGTGLLFFTTLLILGLLLIPYKRRGSVGRLPWVGLTAAILVYLQSLLGGLVASQWAAHQCFGNRELCLVMHSHLAGVVPASVATLILVIMVWRFQGLNRSLQIWGYGAGGCLALQIALGVATFYLHLQVEPLTVSHQAVGAALLGSLVVFTVLAFRQRSAHARVGATGLTESPDLYPNAANPETSPVV